MTRNDTFYKILFAIELALIPLTMAVYVFTKSSQTNWIVGVMVAAVLIVKIWIELFKNKDLRSHVIINAIGNVATIDALVIFFTIYGFIHLGVCIAVVILVALMNALKVLMYGKTMPEIIDAVDSCYMLFECLALAAFTFVIFSQLVTNIALFAILLTSAVSVAYKAFYAVKYYDLIGKLKELFRRK